MRITKIEYTGNPANEPIAIESNGYCVAVFALGKTCRRLIMCIDLASGLEEGAVELQKFLDGFTGCSGDIAPYKQLLEQLKK